MSTSYLACVSQRAADAACEENDAFAELMPWLKVCRVQPSEFVDTGRGMRCTTSVAKGEVLMAIPLAACWTPAAARRIFARLPNALDADVIDALSNENLLVISILILSGAAGATVAVPNTYDECRLRHARLLKATRIETLWDWTDEELQLLCGSKWQMAPSWSRDDTLADFLDFCEYPPLRALFEMHLIDSDAFLWGHKVLNSRMISFKRADGSTLLVVPPAVDLFNHEVAHGDVCDDDVRIERDGGRGVDEEEDEGDAVLVVRATRDYARGEQAFFSYSSASNGRLLMSGGFVLAENPWDSVELALTLPLHPLSTSLYADLAEALDRGGARGGAFAEFMPAEFLVLAPPAEEGARPTEAVLHVRLAAATLDAQLGRVIPFLVAEQLGRAIPADAAGEATLSAAALEDEAQRRVARARLCDCIAALAAGYRAGGSQTLDDDERALAALPAGGSCESRPVHEEQPSARAMRRKHDALRVRIGERRILERAMESLQPD